LEYGKSPKFVPLSTTPTAFYVTIIVGNEIITTTTRN